MQFCSSEAELLGLSSAFANDSFLFRVGRDSWLVEIGLVMNKGTRSKTGWAPYLFLLDSTVESKSG